MKINIKGKNYTIQKKKIIDNDELIGGQVSILRKVIYIKQENIALEETILHELLHAYLYECGVKDYDDEETVTLLSRILPDLFKDYVHIIKSKLYKELQKGGSK